MFGKKKKRHVPDIRTQAETVLKENKELLKAQLAALSGDVCPAKAGEIRIF